MPTYFRLKPPQRPVPDSQLLGNRFAGAGIAKRGVVRPGPFKLMMVLLYGPSELFKKHPDFVVEFKTGEVAAYTEVGRHTLTEWVEWLEMMGYIKVLSRQVKGLHLVQILLPPRIAEFDVDGLFKTNVRIASKQWPKDQFKNILKDKYQAQIEEWNETQPTLEVYDG